MMKKLNKLFPGRPHYIGPATGWFGLLHHGELLEQSHDVMERVAYVKAHKPENEVAVRLHNMIYLGKIGTDYDAKRDALYTDYEAKCDALQANYKAKLAALHANYKAKCDALDAEVLAYIKKHIPDCAWNGKTLVFSKVVA